MGKVQAYVSDETVENIMAIVERRKKEGAREKEVSFSSICSMLIELGLRVYEAQMERKESSFNEQLFYKTLLENVLKTQFAIAKVLGISTLSPHVLNDPRFSFQSIVEEIKEKVENELNVHFPHEETED